MVALSGERALGENALCVQPSRDGTPAPVINGSINKVWLRGDLQIYDFLSAPADVIMADRTEGLSRAGWGGAKTREKIKNKIKGRSPGERLLSGAIVDTVILGTRGCFARNRTSCPPSEVQLRRFRQELSKTDKHISCTRVRKPAGFCSLPSVP